MKPQNKDTERIEIGFLKECKRTTLHKMQRYKQAAQQQNI